MFRARLGPQPETVLAWLRELPGPVAVLDDGDLTLAGEDRRALSPLFWAHVNFYGRFRLDMDTRLDLAAAAA